MFKNSFQLFSSLHLFVNFILKDEKQNMTVENGEHNFIHHINYM